MKTTIFAGVASVFALVAGAAGAQSLSFGVGLTSDYISRGATQTNNGAALQPWVEYGNNGLYVGLWASNVDFGTNDRIEVDLYGGYRWSTGNTNFDAGYARYLYDGVTGDAGGEFYLLVNHTLSDNGAALFAGMHVNPAGGLTLSNAHAGISLPLVDRLTGSGRIGVAGGNTYGDVGVNYAFTDSATVDLRLHGGGTLPNPRLVLSTAFSF